MYIPRQGDICYMDFSPIKGHEQNGLRPAIVISKSISNKYTNMALVCPISSNVKKFPTHYELLNTKKIKGAVLCEHLKSVDFETRELKFVESIDPEELEEIIDILRGIIEF